MKPVTHSADTSERLSRPSMEAIIYVLKGKISLFKSNWAAEVELHVMLKVMDLREPSFTPYQNWKQSPTTHRQGQLRQMVLNQSQSPKINHTWFGISFTNALLWKTLHKEQGFMARTPSHGLLSSAHDKVQSLRTFTYLELFPLGYIFPILVYLAQIMQWY